MRSTCLFLVLACAGAPASALTLSQARDEARTDNAGLAAYREAEGAARAARAAVWGTWLPRAELRQVYIRLDDETVERGNAFLPFLGGMEPGAIPGPSLNLDDLRVYGESHRTEVAVEWALWAGGARLGAARAAGAMVAVAEADVESAQRNLDLDVGSAFLNAWAADENRAVADASLDRAEGYLARAWRSRDVGAATEIDVLRWEVELESARASLANAQAEQEAARSFLGALLGRPVGIDEPLEAPVPERDIPGSDVVMAWAEDDAAFEAWSDRARRSVVEGHPALESARAAADGAAAQVGIATAPLLPSVSVVGSWGYQANETRALDGYEEWNASIVLSVPLLPFVEGYQGRREARARESASRHRFDDVERKLVAGFDALTRRTRASAIGLLHQERASRLAERRSEAVERALESGHASQLDLVDAEVMRRSQALSRIGARAAHWIHVLELEVWVGSQAWNELPNEVGVQE